MTCGRASVILDDGLTVDVVTEFDEVDSLVNQCLVVDNPGHVRIIVRDAIKPSGDIVVNLAHAREYPYGFLARAVKALSDSGLASIRYEDAVVSWRLP